MEIFSTYIVSDVIVRLLPDAESLYSEEAKGCSGKDIRSQLFKRIIIFSTSPIDQLTLGMNNY